MRVFIHVFLDRPCHIAEQVSNTQEQGIVATFQQDKDALEAIATLRKNDPRKVFA